MTQPLRHDASQTRRPWVAAALIGLPLLGGWLWLSRERSSPSHPTDRPAAAANAGLGASNAAPIGVPDESESRLGGYSPEAKLRLLKRLPRPMFREVAAELGIRFQHQSDPAAIRKRAVLEIPMDIAGGGVAAGDFDGDGFDDLFFSGYGGGRLFRNDEGRHFTDVTAAVGLTLTSESRAAYFIDYDNDGDLDLFICRVADHVQLFENDGHGHFKDVSVLVGLNRYRDITHEAVWFDMDNDGLLDVYAASFGRWDQGMEPQRGGQNTNGVPNRLYHHTFEKGQHSFEEIGERAGVADTGWTHSVGAWDFDRDGKPDLFSLNDFGRARIYRNLGQGRFQECSESVQMQPLNNGMGFSVMDLDRDGRFEAFVSEISIPVYQDGQALRYRMAPDATVLSSDTLHFLQATVNNRLYSEMGNGTLTNRFAELFEPAEMGWSWDGSPVDYDNDGSLDFLILNGTENRTPRLKGERRAGHLAQAAFINRYANEANVFFVCENGFWYNVGPACELTYPGNSRGCAIFDFDHDGDLDVAINDFEGSARVFRNEQALGNHWVQLRFQGTRSNRSGIGARVEIEDDQGGKHYALVVSRKGFLSQDPAGLHFGLGQGKGIRRGRVLWPSGVSQEIPALPGDQVHVIRER